jgi:sporadic carbohydrate cluster 2OG-Fe(II) oxygenase
MHCLQQEKIMQQLKKHFLEKGWFIFDFPDAEPVWQTRSFLETELASMLGKKIDLEDYHHNVVDEARHTELQFNMTKFFRENRFGPIILARQYSFFKELLGPDIFGQSNPYLRITRPHKPQDNIGYHRDTFYGGSPYELSVFVPFVDLPEASSLSVLSGSHVDSEEKYPTIQIENPDNAIKKGSAKHQLGFLYAPKVMDNSIGNLMEPISLKVGQALVFNLSTVHGSIVNQGKITRWSSDMRIMHAFAPVDLSSRPDYYKPLSYSVVTEAAKKYLQANGKETRNDVELELCSSVS